MGSIEIKSPSNKVSLQKRQHLCKREKSPFRQAISPKSPYYKQYSPIKFSKKNGNRNKIWIDDQSPIKPVVDNERDRLRYQKTQDKKVEKDSEWQNNRQKCEEIIKKVRNFNDFLLELKKKLKENQSQKEIIDCKKEMSMSVKLQNERVELEKYKNLVERQLSKTHSIDRINIENSMNGQKILTIHYENALVKTKSKDNLSTKRSKKYLDKKQENKENIDFEQSPQIKYKSNIDQWKSLKDQFMSLKNQCKELGQRLSLASQGNENSYTPDSLLNLKVKNEYVRNLLTQIDDASIESEDLEKNMKFLL